MKKIIAIMSLVSTVSTAAYASFDCSAKKGNASFSFYVSSELNEIMIQGVGTENMYAWIRKASTSGENIKTFKNDRFEVTVDFAVNRILVKDVRKVYDGTYSRLKCLSTGE